MVTAYLLAQTIVTPLYGKLGDQYGRKSVLQVGLVVFLMGSALCGLSAEHEPADRVPSAAGHRRRRAAGDDPGRVGDVVPPRERGRYQGIFGAGFGALQRRRPLIGGFFTTHLSWRWIFYINIPLGIAAFVVLAVTLPSSPSACATRSTTSGPACSPPA